MMNKVEYCPVCDASILVKRVMEVVKITVRGEEIPVTVNFESCPECEERWESPSEDMMDRAFRKYRDKYGFLMPEEIKGIRNRYNLTQAELSAFLGFGAVTLSRYENGALQDHTHDNTLRLISKPENMLETVKRNPGILSADKQKKLIDELLSKISINSILELIMSCLPVTELTGHVGYNMEKFTHAVLYFCQAGVGKTKLNKLLFYMDFKHYKEYLKSITGMQYAAINYGPVPDNYETIYESMLKKGLVSMKQIQRGDFVADVYQSQVECNKTLFSAEELAVMELVKNTFQSYTAKKIMNFSHKEKGFKETSQGANIPYTYAESLLL